MDKKLLPLVSVIMPAYNAEQYIALAIRSVQRQSYSNWELIVVDDCSQDKTAEIINRLAAEDARIRPVFSDENQGAADSRNLALDLCRGEYVAFLDADDLWRPQKLVRQVSAALKSNADIVYCSYALVDEAGKPCHRDFIVNERTNLDEMLVRNVMSCSTVLLSHSAAQSHRFSKNVYHEDYALWLQLLQENYSAIGLTEILADYRVLPHSRSSNKLKSAKNRWKIYRSYLKLPLSSSFRYMTEYLYNGVKKYL